MSRLFGWDLPPGCTHAMIEAAMGGDGPCAVCAKACDDCICVMCLVCGETGDLKCYAEDGHGMELTREQVVARGEARVAHLKQAVMDEEQCLGHIRDGGEFSPELKHNPDPWR